MNQVTAHNKQYSKNQTDLYLAFELGKKSWKLGFTVGFGQKPRAVWPGLYTLTGSFDRCPELHEEPCHCSVPLEISQGRQVTGRRLSRAVGFVCPTGGFPPWVHEVSGGWPYQGNCTHTEDTGCRRVTRSADIRRMSSRFDNKWCSFTHY
jgi:hypothetical protein